VARPAIRVRRGVRPPPLSFLRRLSLCFALHRTGALRRAFAPRVLLEGTAARLVTECPLAAFGNLAARHLAVCDLRVFGQLYGYGTVPGLRLTFERLLRQSVACAHSRATPPPYRLSPNMDVRRLEGAECLWAPPTGGPVLLRHSPGRCDWALLHEFEDLPTVSLVTFASPNRHHRAKQLPHPREVAALQDEVRRRFGLSPGAEVSVNQVLLPVDSVDRGSLLRVRRLVGRFPAPVEAFWEEFDHPAPEDEDLREWQQAEDPHAWLAPQSPSSPIGPPPPASPAAPRRERRHHGTPSPGRRARDSL